MFLKWPISGQLILGQPKATLGLTEVRGNFVFTVPLNCWLGYPDQNVAFNFTESLIYVPLINHKSNFKMNFIDDDVWPTPVKIFFHFPQKWLIKQLHYLRAYQCKIFFTIILCCSGSLYASEIMLFIKLELLFLWIKVICYGPPMSSSYKFLRKLKVNITVVTTRSGIEV